MVIFPTGPQCESNTELWTDEFTLCTCSGGQFSCFPSRCPQGQICGSQSKVSTETTATGMCTIHSHTELSTFDGVFFRFISACTYLLATTCSRSDALSEFSVEVVNAPEGISSQSSIQQVNVETQNFRVSFLKWQTQRVVVSHFLPNKNIKYQAVLQTEIDRMQLVCCHYLLRTNHQSQSFL